MTSALPLAYATRHIYSYDNPYRPETTVVQSRRRRRRLPSLLRRIPRTPAPLSTRPAPGR
jgi:hypothetical protein